MKVVVVSDSHGNLANIKHVMGFATKIKAGAIVHCGDWDNTKAVEAALSFKIPLYSVLGNADIDQKVERILQSKCKKFDRVFLEFEIDNKKIGVVHNPNHSISNIELLNILFFGHWQKQKDIVWKGVRTVNPGALEKEINFAVYDTKNDEVELISEHIFKKQNG